MKKNLVATIIIAVIGFVAAYFFTDLLYPGFGNFSFKTLSNTVDSSITTPDEDVFNFRAVNPTVEVYVGQCKEYNENGECVENFTDTTTGDTSDTSDESTDITDESGSTEGESTNGDSN